MGLLVPALAEEHGRLPRRRGGELWGALPAGKPPPRQRVCAPLPVEHPDASVGSFAAGEQRAFLADEVTGIIKEVQASEGCFAGRYGRPTTREGGSSVSSFCAHNSPHPRGSVTCIIMQKNGAGLHTASSCFWDNSSDGRCSDFRYHSITCAPRGLSGCVPRTCSSCCHVLVPLPGSAMYRYDSKTMYTIVHVYGLQI
ncbi:MAG: hypothetical protein BJ554DRAFT_7424 [Olpidium bornovanus]|uniref:Uncharacterized protein n=1 Tax=Olpidium bornovanus TaxID=278681 RepID=A0A8H8DLZ6_9FUNG|nr:MAG: hypothetical protein BJ554DRAFT_7424 [Olpidium bornovanus]